MHRELSRTRLSPVAVSCLKCTRSGCEDRARAELLDNPVTGNRSAQHLPYSFPRASNLAAVSSRGFQEAVALLLVAQQGFHFAAQFFVSGTRLLEEGGTPTFFTLQGRAM